MICVRVPATSANCCVGFDSLGMALDWQGEFRFHPDQTLRITGCPEEYTGTDNLVYQAFAKTFEKAGEPVPPVHIEIDSEIPFARGLGSSSSCIAAGILAANAWMNNPLDWEQMLDLAVEMEGHPDNAAPALFGGLCICAQDVQGKRMMRTVDLEGWKALAVIPAYEVSTKEARKVLPSVIALKDAAAQAGRAMLFEYAISHQEEDLLCRCCIDALHEPSRSVLIREYGWCKAYAQAHGLPFWISGSGPTLLFFSRDEKKLLEAMNACEREFNREEQTVNLKLMDGWNRKAQVQYV